ncbi:hypothetical protein C1H76_3635 [Elsinoe australis]|uniref:Uncharacterized protein n=1 Tax=Elsinoe australis TaxID=40998 RepID=A0A4U7B8W1_9PEZI|nr:hypothetical protein C1H76_3635 [Elsinoe australis]
MFNFKKKSDEEKENISPPTSPASNMAPEASTSASAPALENEDFKKTFERNFNKDLETEHSDPPPRFQHHDVESYLPPLPPAPYATFNIPPLPRRSGIYVPTPIAVLLVLIFLFETSIIVVYTAVALYQTLPAAGFSIGPSRCQGPSQPYGAINVTPNIYMPNAPNAAGMTTIPGTTIPASSQATTTTLGPSPPVATVTADAPTRTFLSTATPSIPSVTTSTIFSTATPERSTVTSVELVTKSAS